jgi:hypothetical protein
MKTYVTSLILFFFSLSAFAQIEIAVGDTTGSSKITRAKPVISPTGRLGVKIGTQPTQWLPFQSEVPSQTAFDNRYVQSGVVIQNPGYIGSLAAAKITGLATVATSGSFNDLINRPTTAAGYNLSDVDTYQTVATYAAMNALSYTNGTARRVLVTADERYGKANQWYMVWADGTGMHADKLVTISEK